MKNKLIRTLLVSVLLADSLFGCSSKKEVIIDTENGLVYENEESQESSSDSIFESSKSKEIILTKDNFWDYFELYHKAIKNNGEDDPFPFDIDSVIALKEEYRDKLDADSFTSGKVTLSGTYAFETARINDDGSVIWDGSTIPLSSKFDNIAENGLDTNNTFYTERDLTKRNLTWLNEEESTLSIWLPQYASKDGAGPTYYMHYTNVNVESVDYTLRLFD